MGPETIIKSIEILPNGIIQIDFESDGKKDRCFCTQGEFFGMYGDAVKIYQKRLEEFYRIHEYKKHIAGEIEIIDDKYDGFKILSKEDAEKEMEAFIKESGVDYDTYKMYLLGA